MQNKIDSLFHHWAYKWNEQNKARNFYVKFKFRTGDKGTILMLLLGQNSNKGTIKFYLPMKLNLEQKIINGSTIQQFSSGAGFNGQVIEINSDGTYNLVITNVEAYATIEMFASNCELLASWFGN